VTMQTEAGKSFKDTFYRHGYFFREAAMLTILMGVLIHLLRVIFGDDFAMAYVVTPTTDKILLVPMAYAAITGIVLLAKRRAVFVNKRHRAVFTGSVVYIAASVPLHVYCSYIIWDTSLMTWFPMWFSWFLLIVVYPAFLVSFAKLQYRN
jgi:hypothetical protein